MVDRIHHSLAGFTGHPEMIRLPGGTGHLNIMLDQGFTRLFHADHHSDNRPHGKLGTALQTLFMIMKNFIYSILLYPRH